MAIKKSKSAAKKTKKAKRLTIEDLRNVTGGLAEAFDMECKIESDHNGRVETDKCPSLN